MRKILLAILLLGAAASVSLAADPQRFSSARSAGMGGTQVAVENGIDAIHANPALMEAMDGHFHILSVKGEYTDLTNKDKLSDFSSNVEKINNDNTKSDAQKNADMITEMQKVVPLKAKANFAVGVPLGLIIPSLPVFDMVSDKMGFSVFNNVFIGAGMVNPTDPRFKLQYRADVAGVLGLSKKIEAGLIPFGMDFGVNLKSVMQYKSYNRLNGTDVMEIGPGDLAKMGSKFDAGALPVGYTSGSGMGIDLGMITNFPFLLDNAKFGMVVKDLATTLTGDKVTDVSANTKESFKETIPMTARIGIAGKTSIPLPVPVIDGLLTDLTVAADYDIISPETSMFKRIHLGLEKCLLDGIVKLRVGNNQGNMTYGAALDLFVLHVSYTNFTEELGRKVGIDPVTYQVVEVGFYF